MASNIWRARHGSNFDLNHAANRDELYAKRLQEEEIRRLRHATNDRASQNSSNNSVILIDSPETSPARPGNLNAKNPELDTSRIRTCASPHPPFSSQSSARASSVKVDTSQDEQLARRLQEELDRESAASLRNRLQSPGSFGTSMRQSSITAYTNRSSMQLTGSGQTRYRSPSFIANRGASSVNGLPRTIPLSIQNEMMIDMARSNATTRSRLDAMPGLNSAEPPSRDSRTVRDTTHLTNAFNFIQGISRQNDQNMLEDFGLGLGLRPSTSRSQATNRTRNNAATTTNITTNSRSSRTANSQSYSNIRPETAETYILNRYIGQADQSYRHRHVGEAGRHMLFSDRDFGEQDYESLLRLDELICVKKGVSRSELATLPTFEYKGSSQASSDCACSICFDDYARSDMVTALACSHKFHKNCIKKWFEQNRRCPLCQKDAITGK